MSAGSRTGYAVTGAPLPRPLGLPDKPHTAPDVEPQGNHSCRTLASSCGELSSMPMFWPSGFALRGPGFSRLGAWLRPGHLSLSSPSRSADLGSRCRGAADEMLHARLTRRTDPSVDTVVGWRRWPGGGRCGSPRAGAQASCSNRSRCPRRPPLLDATTRSFVNGSRARRPAGCRGGSTGASFSTGCTTPAALKTVVRWPPDPDERDPAQVLAVDLRAPLPSWIRPRSCC